MNLKTITLIAVSAIALSGCSHGFTERKAPCPPTAYTGKNPCNPIPINMASLYMEGKELHS